MGQFVSFNTERFMDELEGIMEVCRKNCGSFMEVWEKLWKNYGKVLHLISGKNSGKVYGSFMEVCRQKIMEV